MAKSTFKPQNLKSILAFLLVFVVVGGAGVFYLGLNAVRDYAIEVNHSLADAEASGSQIEALQALKEQLSDSEALVAKADKLFSTPDNYQNQALVDVRQYASIAGLTVSKTNFEEAAVAGGNVMVVTLAEPVSYSKLIHFLDGIEGNIPKMQVSSIALSHVSGGGADSVKVGDIKIIISTR